MFLLQFLTNSDWLTGQVDELFGIPAFWLIRAAKLIQLLSGLYIVSDLLGAERVQQLAVSLQAILSILSAGFRRLGVRLSGIIGRLWEVLWFAGLAIFTTGPRKKEYEDRLRRAKYFWPIVFLSLISGAAILIYASVRDPVGHPLDISDERTLEFLGQAIIISFIYIVFGGVAIAIAIMFVGYVLLWLFETIVSLVAQAISARGLSTVWLRLSLALFLFGSILEIIAS